MGLSEDDINYYLKEWSCHNAAWFACKIVNKITKNKCNKIVDYENRAKTVDLNTSDSKSFIYRILGGICEAIF